MIDLHRITYAKRPAKPTIRKTGKDSLPWVLTAHPVRIETQTWERALKALCELYLYGIDR